MKKIFYLLLVPIMIAGLFAIDSMDVFSGQALANESSEAEANIVTVNGEGTIRVKPDIAYINVGVEIFDTDAKKAQDDNAKLMDKIVSAVKKNGINDEDIKTISYNIYKSTKYEESNYGEKGNKIEGYYARNVVEVTVRDIDNVGKIIDIAGSAGANVIGNIRFGISNEEEYYNQSLKLAMENASNKANTILNTFGAKADKPYRIYESSNGGSLYYDTYRTKSAMAVESYNTSVEAGELEVTASVTVEYKY